MIRLLRRFLVSVALSTFWLFAATPAFAAPASDAQLMHESFQKFDQQLDTGWRTLQVRRDYLGAAAAIREYQSEHAAQLKTWQQGSLAFHLAHVYALAGNQPEAIRWLRQSMAGHWAGNPAYIKAFIAFLQNDKPALIKARHVIATTNPGPWQAEDLSEVDAMIDYFGEPFEAAWGALNCHESRTTQKTPAWKAYCQAVDIKYRKLYLQHGIKLKTALH
jgi:hypothetical protein